MKKNGNLKVSASIKNHGKRVGIVEPTQLEKVINIIHTIAIIDQGGVAKW
jgi:hypothetical protein